MFLIFECGTPVVSTSGVFCINKKIIKKLLNKFGNIKMGCIFVLQSEIKHIKTTQMQKINLTDTITLIIIFIVALLADQIINF